MREHEPRRHFTAGHATTAAIQRACWRRHLPVRSIEQRRGPRLEWGATPIVKDEPLSDNDVKAGGDGRRWKGGKPNLIQYKTMKFHIYCI
jgi:hypothetical protein